MHQFQPPEFKAALDALEADSAALKAAQAGGADFWETSFAELTN